MNHESYIYTSEAKCIVAGEEGEDDARSACPFDTLGYTRDTMAHYKATQYRKVEQIVKSGLSSD